MPSTLQARFTTFGEFDYGSFAVASGQTFKADDFVYLDSNGQLTIMAASGNDVGNIRGLGVSLGDAADCLAQSTLTGKTIKCEVKILIPGLSFFTLPVYHSTAASAVIAENEIDTPLTLPLRNQGGIWVVNKENNGTNDRIIVKNKVEDQPWSEQYGLFICTVMDAFALMKAS